MFEVALLYPDKQQGAASMKKRFAAFVSTVLAAVLCACSAAPKDVLPDKAAQPIEAPTQQAQTTQAAPTEQPTPEPDPVQQLLEEHGDGARVPFGEGVNLPDARDEVGHRGDVGGVVAVLRGRGAELREGGFQIVLEGGVVPVGHRLPCEDELALRDVVVAVVLLVEGLFHKAAEEATVDGAQGGGGEGEPVGVQSVADAGAHEVGLLGVAVDAALDLLVVVVVYDVARPPRRRRRWW